MKRVTVFLFILFFMFSAIPIGEISDNSIATQNYQHQNTLDFANPSDVSGVGNEGAAIAFMSRTIDSQVLDISNSYENPSLHSGALDLSNYLIPGWDLYEVSIETSSITAIAEHESFGINPNSYINTVNSSGLVRDALYQEFYSQPHDGKLNNYTFSYLAYPYDDSLGEAYLVVRSNFSDSNTNVTGYITPFDQVYSYTPVIHDCSSDNAILDASTKYYVVIDGTAMQGVYTTEWKFNTIYWRAQYPLLGLETGYHIRDGIWDQYDSGEMREAELNYTYTPWNTSANSALAYSDPAGVNLEGNSTALSGLSWVFTGQNVSYLDFDSDQSVSISFNLELSYKKQVVTTSLWEAIISGDNIHWNTSTSVEYPAVAEQKYLNFSIPATWSVTGLYNSTMPAINHGYYEDLSTIVRCSNMENETWTLSSTSHNYLTSINTYDASDDSDIIDKASMDINVDINSTILEEDLDPVTSGTLNLTILYAGSSIWSPSTQSVTDGTSHYLWDIGATSTLNGLYTIHEFWSNGTEAGYRTRELTLYFPTTLTPAESQIDGYTENTVDISVYFNDTFTPQGLDESLANVAYSFQGEANVTLIHQGSGTWAASIDTTGRSPGTYPVYVYAEGYALENQSITIEVTLIHETQPLNITWSNTNDISYVQSTVLSVGYNTVGGAPVTGALVNVTIDSTTWNLTWDGGDEVYKITFNGTDIDPGFGTHSLLIIAEKIDYQPQTNDTIVLDVHEESTIFNLEWSGSTNITYVESVTLYLDYQMSNSTAIPQADVEITIDTDVYILHWNGTSKRYWLQFNGSDTLPGFGFYLLSIEASKFGYEYQSDLTQTLNITEEPTTLVLSWSNGNTLPYVNSTTLIANFTQSDGSPIYGAEVNVTIGSGFWEMVWNPTTFVYEYTIDGNDTLPGFGTHGVTVLAGKTGFVNRSDSTQSLTVLIESTTMTVSWSNTDNITFIEQTTLIVSYRMSNNTPIPYATINVTISGTRWDLEWHESSETYRVTFSGSDVQPGFGTHSLTIRAGRYGYENHVNSTETLTIVIAPTNYEVSWSNTNSITFVESTTLIVNYTTSYGLPVTGATINVTIGVDRWDLLWDDGTDTYRIDFSGTDIPPGFGTHDLTIRIGRYGYENHVDTTETLAISEEPTTMLMAWLDDFRISYLESTTLIVNYRMSNTSPISDATVTVTVSGIPYSLVWHPGSQTYRYNFSGTDDPPGFGTHSLTIEANKTGYESQIDYGEVLIISEEPTNIEISWTNTNTITFLDSTILIVNYTMINGSAVIGADVNVTIGGTPWDLDWDAATETYRVEFFGDDEPPGLGAHDLTIFAGRFGYVNQTDVSQDLILQREPTILTVSWIPDNDITFTTSSILAVSYQMSDFTPISAAMVNVTINSGFWQLIWSEGNQDYRIQLNGSDVPPGFGTHSVNVQASKKGFDPQTDATETVTYREEPTSLVISWSNGHDLGFYEYTYLFVNYRMENLSTILGATLNVTINGYMWQMTWNNTEGKYQMRFNGSDTIPGVGTHSLTIKAGKAGYVNQIDSSQTLTLPVIPTSLSLSWTNGNSITYVEQTTLRVIYEMFNGTRITNATVELTIGLTAFYLNWSETTEAYEHTFLGSDNPPGIGFNSLSVLALKTDFQSQGNTAETLTISIEETSLSISWTNTNNISYHSNTTLSVKYLMSDGITPIPSALLNATIGGTLFNLTWNPISEAYETTIQGSDNPPGFDTHSVDIEASRYGFEPQTDSSQELTLRVEDTSLEFEWVPSSTITFVEETTLRIFYLMSNGSWIEDATVNVTISTTVWNATWNPLTHAYEVTFYGDDDRIPYGPQTCLVQASKQNYQSLLNSSQTLTKNEEPTTIEVTWTNGDYITYSESTTIQINFTMSNGTVIPDANVTVSTISDTWDTTWNPILEVYELTFIDPNPWPGLGVHGLEISGNKTGYVTNLNTTFSLTIIGENGLIDSYWLGDGSITFVETDTLVVNYTLLDGTPISEATVNVTIGGDLWNLTWHPASETYRITFNGSDTLPGFGTHSLWIEAWREGYDWLPDSSRALIVTEEPTSLVITWSNTDSITYFDHTYLFVSYLMSNASMIMDASVNVTIAGVTQNLLWNSTQGAYGILFSGSDNPPGLGMHSLIINATKYGYEIAEDLSESLTLSKDPTTLEILWLEGNSITYVENTTLFVYYRMSNGSLISTGFLNVTIGEDYWDLVWNATAQAYQIIFNGTMNPPGLGTFSLSINASADIFGDQVTSTTLTITNEQTFTIASWITNTFDWTQSAILGIEYMDSYGHRIPDATLKTISIDGSVYTLLGTNGTYWFEFNNTFDLGHHLVEVNISKYGYDFAVNASISFDIEKAATNLVLQWNTTTIDYLGQITLSANYTYAGTGQTIPGGLVDANITINGLTTLNLIQNGDLWTITLDGDYLDLGSHDVSIICEAYGYDFAESSDTLVVEEVSTISSSIFWVPSNLTIEYTDSLELVVDYTYSGGDVPATALVNVTVDGHFYNLTYSSGAWRVSISGSDLGIGLHDADISAWLHGYQSRAFSTSGINVTVAANSFIVTWEPWDMTPIYTDQVNLTVVYTEDFSPILDATIKLYINGTDYDVVYNATDEMWHLSIPASNIDLGVWNVTVTANKTGYADGYFSDILTVVEAPTTIDIQITQDTIYYDETTTVDVFYQLLNLSSVPGAGISFTLNSIEQAVSWSGDHWTTVLNGTELSLGVHTFEIAVSAYGYENQSGILEVTVLQIPTSIIIDTDIVMVARDTVSFRFTYLDDRVSSPIYGTDFTYIWSEVYSVNMLPNYTYVVTIGGSDFHVGNYTFQVTVDRMGFDNSTADIDIEAIPIPTELIHDTNYSQFEYENITIDLQLINSIDLTIINWANVTIKLDGTEYLTSYINDNDTYIVTFRIPYTVAPGTYILYLYATADDCQSVNETAQFEVLAKHDYELSIIIAQEVQAGSSDNVSILVTEDNEPVSGIFITVTITFYFEEGEPFDLNGTGTSNSAGIVFIPFDIPELAYQLTIVARYEGSINSWPVEAHYSVLDVKPVPTTTGVPVVLDPLTIGIVTGGIGLPILALAFRRRRKGGVKAPVVTTPTSVPTAAPVGNGMLQKVIDEIKTSEDGITRAELSRRLGPSASKISAMVKDLLDTNHGFYEVRDGAKKLIKFKED